MTSRQKRFRKKQAENVRKLLKGYVGCPKCKEYVEPTEVFESIWIATGGVACEKCRDKIEVEFIRMMTKDFDAHSKTMVKARTTKIYGKTLK